MATHQIVESAGSRHPQHGAARRQLQERMAHRQDDTWCAREDNNAPIAYMADAFRNLRHLRRNLRDARVYVQVKNGSRSVLVRQDAAATWEKAERFYLGNEAKGFLLYSSASSATRFMSAKSFRSTSIVAASVGNSSA